jgi:hypothetical protein
MLHITYEAVRPGVPRTEVCLAKVWQKLDGTHGRTVQVDSIKTRVESAYEVTA